MCPLHAAAPSGSQQPPRLEYDIVEGSREGEAVLTLQRWWRCAKLRLHWLDLIDELTINAELKRRRREWDAVERLQRWLRRRMLRTNWLRIVEEAKARRDRRRSYDGLTDAAAPGVWAPHAASSESRRSRAKTAATQRSRSRRRTRTATRPSRGASCA